jgi:hypothetical protein
MHPASADGAVASIDRSMFNHPPITRASERWQGIRRKVAEPSADWLRVLEAHRNWRRLAQALRPYFEEISEPGTPLSPKYYLERIDKRHRYGKRLERLRLFWLKEGANKSFFDWLDVNEEKLGDIARKEVKYFDAEERRYYEVKIKGNRIVAADENRLRAALRNSPNGEVMFVEDREGRMFAFPKFKYELHHSSFLAGTKVAMAGLMEVDADLRVRTITNHSGHYPMGEDKLEAFLSRLEPSGGSLPLSIRVVVIANDGTESPPYSAGLWLRTRRKMRRAREPQAPSEQ